MLLVLVRLLAATLIPFVVAYRDSPHRPRQSPGVCASSAFVCPPTDNNGNPLNDASSCTTNTPPGLSCNYVVAGGPYCNYNEMTGAPDADNDPLCPAPVCVPPVTGTCSSYDCPPTDNTPGNPSPLSPIDGGELLICGGGPGTPYTFGFQCYYQNGGQCNYYLDTPLLSGDVDAGNCPYRPNCVTSGKRQVDGSVQAINDVRSLETWDDYSDGAVDREDRFQPW